MRALTWPLNMKRRADDFDRFLGGLIRTRRLEIDMTMEELAALVGVAGQQVQKYEAGCNQVSVARLIQIAAALNVQPAHFLPTPVRAHSRSSVGWRARDAA